MRISASQHAVADLCMRKYGFRYVLGLPEPKTAAMEEGTLGHARIERWLKNGEPPGDDRFGKLVSAAIEMGAIALPMPGLLVEHEFYIPLPDTNGIGAGHSFYGFIDCVIPPGYENRRAVVVDNKFTSDVMYAKTPDELRTDPQAISYSKAAIDMYPGQLDEVENRWVYLQKGSKIVKPVSIVRSKGDVYEAWAKTEARSIELVQIRQKKIEPNQLPEGDDEACHAFRKPCPYMAQCDKWKAGSRARSFFGSRSGSNLFTNNVNNSTTAQASAQQTAQGEEKMATTVMEQLKALKIKAMGGGSTAPAPAAEPAKAAPAPVDKTASEKPAPAKAPAKAPEKVATAKPAAGMSALAQLQAISGAKGVNPPEGTPEARAAREEEWRKKKADDAAKQAIADTAAQEARSAEIEAEKAHAAAEQALLSAIQAEEMGAPGATEVRVAAEAALEKPKRTRAAKSALSGGVAPPSATTGQLSVLFAAAVVKYPDNKNTKPVQLIELLAPHMRAVADGANVAHWSLIKFGEGKALLAHAFDAWLAESQWKGTIVASDSEETYAVKSVLEAHADVIVRGTRE